jgi:uncharacterized protein (TIGR03086 family)
MAFEKSVLVPLGGDETFALITEPARLRRWQAVTARVDLRAGGSWRWTVIPGNSAAGTVTELEPGRRVVFSWGWEGSAELPPGASTVTITLEPGDGGTTVRLVHDGLAGEQAASHAEGWDHYLARLAAAGASGDAGPDSWIDGLQDLTRLQAAAGALATCQRVLRGAASAGDPQVLSCPGLTVTGLAGHLLSSVTYLGGAAGAQLPDPASGPGLTPETAEARIADAAQAALEAWDRRGLDGTVTTGGFEMPAPMAVGILGIEFLVHAWDFAQATGQQVTAPDQVTRHIMDAAQQIITPQSRGGGQFADPTAAGPDAGLLDRLIAFTGRAVHARP